MKKVLIITYYWPPAGGAGVQRVLKFAKYLPQFGWQPIILTVPKPDSPIDDNSLLDDIPSEAKVYKVAGFEPFDLYKKFTGKKSDEHIPADVLQKAPKSIKEKIANWIRFNIFIPDAKIGWYFSAVKEGVKIVENEKIDLIFSSGPPHTTALIGKKISEKTKKKWVADFRDPWLEIVFYQNVKRNAITLLIDKHLEKSVLNNADVVTTISKGCANLFKTKVNRKIKVIENGFDDSDIPKIEKKKNSVFTISYTGAISPDRIPKSLIKILPRFLEQVGTDILFTFAGRFCQEFYDEIKKFNIESLFELKSFLPHSESTKILQTSDVLLLVVNNVPNNKGIVTGKMFEYLGIKNPIFAIAPIDGEVNEILTKTNSGKVVDYFDEENTFKLLKEYYLNWKENKNNFTFDIQKYSRKNQTEELTKIFKELVN